MRFSIQRYSDGKDAPNMAGVFIELTTEQDLPALLRDGFIKLPICSEGGEVVQTVTVYLKGRGLRYDSIT